MKRTAVIMLASTRYVVPVVILSGITLFSSLFSEAFDEISSDHEPDDSVAS